MQFLKINNPKDRLKQLKDKEQEEKTERAIGIDFGTTNSLIAISNHKKPEVLLYDKINCLIPSVLLFTNDQQRFVGKKAMSKFHDNDGVLNTSKEQILVRSVKRLIGKSVSDIDNDDISIYYKNLIDKNCKDHISFKIFEKNITPIEISSYLLKYIKKTAENNLKREVNKAVITVPSYFDDSQRLATKQAAELAGLEVLRLVNEPTAAALAYGLDTGSRGIFMVYDLGGGTFDISILKLHQGVFQVLSSCGDTALGGDDFDQVIFSYWIRQIESDYKVKITSENEMQLLLLKSKEAKEKLSFNTSFIGNINIENKKFTLKLELSDFQNMISKFIDQTIDIANRAILDADIDLDDLKGIIMVGGSTRIPLIVQKLQEKYKTKIFTNIDPDKVVALGAALQAEALTGGENSDLLLDVNALSLGIETMGGLTEKIIKRNTVIPTQVCQEFTTAKDNQTGIELHIVQGERELVKDNRSLAKFTLKPIPPMIAGKPKVEVQFKIDADGLLTVSAIEKISKVSQEVLIKPSHGIKFETMKQMITDSNQNAKEDMLERVLINSKIHATEMIEAIQRILKHDSKILNKKEIKLVKIQVKKLKEFCKQNDKEKIDIACEELEEIMSNYVKKTMDNTVSSFLSGKNINEIDKKLDDIKN